ncbi:NUDIX domain-containing protein [Mycolicibacterium crocinum]|uniref:NUDIX domain-containing protein n=1 Tax=Mycolicibacterium crocinum TaxID=388459 RepID=A0ABY3TML7_9MYCO|nr:NUDIX domain-containing protein [Mycolicibacterium crocinum]ULN42478.1 NUDIX domain-containing protein [Mycolicibacterium crocinum]
MGEAPLHNYPRPTLAVDTALLTWDPDLGLLVAEMARDDVGKWALPGAFVRKGETLADAVERSLQDKLGVRGMRPRQLHVFDAPDRDDRDWVVSVAHVAVVRPDQLSSLGSGSVAQTRLAPVDRPGELAWDHPEIVRLAKTDIRQRYEAEADPERLLGNRFTMRDLRQVHEAIAGRKLQRDKFRRTMEPRLVGTGAMEENTGTRGRPAELFRRKR